MLQNFIYPYSFFGVGHQHFLQKVDSLWPDVGDIRCKTHSLVTWEHYSLLIDCRQSFRPGLCCWGAQNGKYFVELVCGIASWKGLEAEVQLDDKTTKGKNINTHVVWHIQQKLWRSVPSCSDVACVLTEVELFGQSEVNHLRDDLVLLISAD